MTEKKKSVAQKVKSAVQQALGLAGAAKEEVTDVPKPVAEQKPAEPIKELTPAPTAKPAGGTSKAKAAPKPVAEQKPVEPVPVTAPAPAAAPTAKPTGGTSAAARMMTRGVAGKLPAASTAKARRAADAARSSQKPVAGVAGPKIRRGASKGR